MPMPFPYRSVTTDRIDLLKWDTPTEGSGYLRLLRQRLSILFGLRNLGRNHVEQRAML